MPLTTIPASLSETALTLTTAAQTNITAVGTLTGLASSGALAVTNQVAIKEIAPGIESGHSSAHSLQVGRWSGTNNRWMIVPEPEGSPLYSRELSYDFSTDTWAVEGDFAATLSTAAQPNITSVGTLTTLNVSGALTGTTAVLTSADNSAQLVLKSTDDDAAVGPLLDLTRDSASPAANDVAGKIRFMADNDAGSSVSFGAIGMTLKDVSNGSEDGEFTLTTKLNGTNRSRIKSNNTETVINDDSQTLNFRVESDANTHMLFVDAANDRVGIKESTPATQFHVTTASQDDGITIECTNGGTAAGPSLKLDRSSATPANNDDLGEIEFRGRNNAGESTQYARILSEILDVTDGAESGSINLQALLAGTARSRFFSNATETVINEGGQDLDFRVESDNNANMFVVNAGSNRVHIGSDSSISVGSNMLFTIQGTQNTAGMSLSRNTNDTSGGSIQFAKSRGTAVNSTTIVQDGDTLGGISFRGADGTDTNSSAARMRAQVDGTPGANDMPGRLLFETTSDGGTTTTERMRIDSRGNIGIGVVPETWQSGVDALQVGLAASLVGNTTNPSRTYLNANAYINSSNVESYVATDEASQYFQNAGTHLFKVAASGSANSAISWTTAMTIDNSGHVLVGRTSVGATGDGHSIRAADSAIFSRDGGEALILNRDTNQGTLIQIRQAGTNRGLIGTVANDVFIASADSGHNGLRFHADGILPTKNAGAIVDADANLGDPSYRFKDLYLSGGVYLGGTAGGNKLEEYEHGSHAVTAVGATSGSLSFTSNNSLAYARIGRVVHVQGQLAVASTSGTLSGSVRFSLPFAVANLGDIMERGVGTCAIQGVNHGGFATLTNTSDTGVSFFTILIPSNNGNYGTLSIADIGAGDDFRFGFTYITTD